MVWIRLFVDGFTSVSSGIHLCLVSLGVRD